MPAAHASTYILSIQNLQEKMQMMYISASEPTHGDTWKTLCLLNSRKNDVTPSLLPQNRNSWAPHKTTLAPSTFRASHNVAERKRLEAAKPMKTRIAILTNHILIILIFCFLFHNCFAINVIAFKKHTTLAPRNYFVQIKSPL